MIWLPAEGSNLQGVGYAQLKILHDWVIHKLAVIVAESLASEINNAESAQIR